jgi:hypothetical protein
MVSKVKVDAIESTTGSGTIALNNQFSGMTVASLPSTGSPPSIFGGGIIGYKFVDIDIDLDTTAEGSSNIVATNHTTTYTPSSSSSTIIVKAYGVFRWRLDTATAYAGEGAVMNLYRDSTDIGEGLQYKMFAKTTNTSTSSPDYMVPGLIVAHSTGHTAGTSYTWVMKAYVTGPSSSGCHLQIPHQGAYLELTEKT